MFFKKNDDILNILTILESYLKDEINYLPEINFSSSKMSRNVKEFTRCSNE
jgi:hypothetical protein